jgi:hypothetical protein
MWPGTISASDAIQVSASSLTFSSGIPGAIRYNGGALELCDGSTWTGFAGTGASSGDRIISGTTNITANQIDAPVPCSVNAVVAHDNARGISETDAGKGSHGP